MDQEKEDQLPEHYYRAEHLNGSHNDGDWILYKFQSLTLAQREKACIAYSKVYQEQSRYHANQRLCQFVDRCKGVATGKTISPPRMRT